MDTKFNNAEIRGMEAMRRMGKTYQQIAFCFNCSGDTVRRLLNPHLNKIKNEKRRQKNAIGKAMKDEADRGREKIWVMQPKGRGSLVTMRNCSTTTCHFTCCSEWRKCQEKDAPQDCLVWKMMMKDNMLITTEGSERRRRVQTR